MCPREIGSIRGSTSSDVYHFAQPVRLSLCHWRFGAEAVASAGALEALSAACARRARRHRIQGTRRSCRPCRGARRSSGDTSDRSSTWAGWDWVRASRRFTSDVPVSAVPRADALRHRTKTTHGPGTGRRSRSGSAARRAVGRTAGNSAKVVWRQARPRWRD
jgi:hypothetical protein